MIFGMLYEPSSTIEYCFIGSPPHKVDKQEFLRLYPRYQHTDGALERMLQTSLALPEIQAQVVRALKTHDLTQEERTAYTRFLVSSQAPSGSAFRYTGEKWVLLHASVEQLHAHNIFIPNVRNWGKEHSVAPLSKFEHTAVLQRAQIAYELTWESEIPEAVRCTGPFRVLPL